MTNLPGRAPRPWIAIVLIAVSFAVVGLRPTQAQRPPVPPPGGRNPQPPGAPGGNPANVPGNPAAPAQPNPPAQPGSNSNGNRDGQGFVPVGRPGGPPQPGAHPGSPPMEIIWRCTNCNADLGHGTVKPTITVCPNCGAYLDPNYSPKSVVNNAAGPSSVPPVGLLGFACFGLLGAVVVVALLYKWAIG
jgi:hypothetical protein